MGIKNYLLFPVLLFTYHHAIGHGIDTVEAEINVRLLGGQAMFSASLPPLAGIPGGRQPFYTYLWDFGDGHFSTEESPRHEYSSPGDYNVTLYTVNNYDNGPRPKRPTRKIKVDSTKAAQQSAASAAERSFFQSDSVFRLSKNANALPGQDMVVIAGLRSTEKGRVFLLTNERIFDGEGFVYTGQSTHNGETVLPVEDSRMLEGLWAGIPSATVTQSGSPDYGIREEMDFEGSESIAYFKELYGSYRTVTSYMVQGREQAQFSLINLDITPEMLADTNATVTVTGVFIPEKGPARIHRLDIPIITSHDPNVMSIKQSRLNYRLLSGRKELTYKVQFQNDGEGDARNIRLEVRLPEALDPYTFRLLNLYPKCDSCTATQNSGCYDYRFTENNTLEFHFRGIALPGSRAPDVHDRDSTQGFIRFAIRAHRRLPNKPFRGRTDIYFDKNDPVTTNFATGRFRKSVSPLVFAGYPFFMERPEIHQDNGGATVSIRNAPLFGIGLAPIAPYRKLYWQVEAYANTYRAESRTPRVFDPDVLEYTDPGTGDTVRVDYEYYDRSRTSRFLQLRVVPLHIRYNFSSWVSAGIGASAAVTFNTSHREDRTYYVPAPTEGEMGIPFLFSRERLPRGKWNIQPFADINVGRTYLGPALGLRYLYGSKHGQSGHIYAAWRF